MALAFPLFHNLALKCVKMTPSSIETFIKAAAAVGDKNEYENVLRSALRVGTAESINEFAVKYPLQEPVLIEEPAVVEVEAEGGTSTAAPAL